MSSSVRRGQIPFGLLEEKRLNRQVAKNAKIKAESFITKAQRTQRGNARLGWLQAVDEVDKDNNDAADPCGDEVQIAAEFFAHQPTG